MGNDAVLGDDDDAVPDEVERMVHVVRFAGGGDDDIVADAGVLIDDGIFDAGVLADADARACRGLRFRRMESCDS